MTQMTQEQIASDLFDECLRLKEELKTARLALKTICNHIEINNEPDIDFIHDTSKLVKR